MADSHSRRRSLRKAAKQEPEYPAVEYPVVVNEIALEDKEKEAAEKELEYMQEHDLPFFPETADESELLLLLRHLYTYPSYMDAMFREFKFINPFKGTPHLHMQDLFAVLMEHWENAKSIPSTDLTWTVLLALEESLHLGDNKEALRDMFKLRAGWHRFPTQPDHDHVRDLLRDIREDFYRARLHDLTAEDGTEEEGADGLPIEQDRDELKKAMGELLTQLNVDPFGVIRPESPFTNLRHYLRNNIRNPTYIDWLDQMLGGGVAPGELIGVLAPPGGGKTTLAMQICEGQITAGEAVDYIQTEQSLEFEPDMTIRLMALAMRISKNTLGAYDWLEENKGSPEVPQEVWERIDAFKDDWNRLFRFWDQTSNKQPLVTLDTLFEPMRQYLQTEEGAQRPKIIVLDWWGLLRDRLISGSPEASRGDAASRRLSRIWMQDLRNYGKEVGAGIIVTHQLAGSVAGKSSKYAPTGHDAAEDKSFPNLMDLNFTISKADRDGRLRLSSDKARRCERMVLDLILDGEFSKIRLPSADETVSLADDGMTDMIEDADSPRPRRTFSKAISPDELDATGSMR